MASVTHAGRPVIDESDGGWNFVPGAKGREVQLIRLAKSTKMRAKDLGVAGCPLSLSIDFVGTESQFSNWKDDISDLYDMTIGTLSVPLGENSSANTYIDTIFVGTPSFSEPIALADGEILVNVQLELIQL